MERLAVFCDGTWQTEAQDSNVARLHEAYLAAGAPADSACYLEGVGTRWWTAVRAGITGAGLEAGVERGYRFLVERYRPGTRIAVFGFSRGAYTARALAGMVARMGLVGGPGVDAEVAAGRAIRAYQRYKEGHRGVRPLPPVDPAWRAGLPLAVPPGADPSPIDFVGVWDTVGALGIPSYVGVPDLLNSRGRYEFLDADLPAGVKTARHAVALDERRGPFRPTLWTPPNPDQDQLQRWFPGDHCDVGGGHRGETGLSDDALLWMAEEAAKTVDLRCTLPERVRAVPLARAHGRPDGWTGAVDEAVFQPRPRAVPRIDASDRRPDVAPAAYARQTALGYRLSRTAPAEAWVPAAESWVDTGIWLEADVDYVLSARGEWASAGSASGPDGNGGARAVAGRLVSGVAGVLERGLRGLLRNPGAEVPLSRRHDEYPWMSLVGVVANDGEDPPATDGPAVPPEHQTFPVGTVERRVRPRRFGGYLYAYANDALGCYGNNTGGVLLTVRPA